MATGRNGRQNPTNFSLHVLALVFGLGFMFFTNEAQRCHGAPWHARPIPSSTSSRGQETLRLTRCHMNQARAVDNLFTRRWLGTRSSPLYIKETKEKFSFYSISTTKNIKIDMYFYILKIPHYYITLFVSGNYQKYKTFLPSSQKRNFSKCSFTPHIKLQVQELCVIHVVLQSPVPWLSCESLLSKKQWQPVL